MKKFTEQLKKLLYPDEEAVATKDSETARLGRAVRRWAAQAYRFMTTVGKVFSKDRCFQIGAVLTYVTLLSIFPLVAVLLFLVPVFFSAEQTRMEVGEFILKGLIPSTGEWFDKQLESYFQVFHEKAAGIGAMGLVFLFLMAVIMFVVVERSFNDHLDSAMHRGVVLSNTEAGSRHWRWVGEQFDELSAILADICWADPGEPLRTEYAGKAEQCTVRRTCCRHAMGGGKGELWHLYREVRDVHDLIPCGWGDTISVGVGVRFVVDHFDWCGDCLLFAEFSCVADRGY
jgi:hypothetical protein